MYVFEPYILRVVRERQIQKLKEKVHQLEDELASAQKRSGQLEDELASAQRQTRLALARAVRAEIEADKVAVLEQQLSQTKTNLEEQIHMKDQARIAAEQQLQQTKAALEYELQMKDQAEQQSNQAKAGLQHEIQLRDQAISTLHQQMHQMKATWEHQTEVNKQAIASAQQQSNHRMKALENQMKAREQALEIQIQTKDREKVELEQHLCQREEQIQARDRKKAELEQQLHQKEEQILSKEKEKAELEQQLRQREEHGPPEVTQVAEMQQEGSVHVTAQGEVPSVHQLLQAREEVRKKEEELRKMREKHEAELSRLTHESTAKQEEIEFELNSQIKTKSDVLQIQVDVLQHDREDLQLQLKAKDIKITAISSELQHDQHRIESLTDENNKMAAQINSLEAKLTKAEFLEGVSSQEIDKLREELMDKEVEIDYFRKQQRKEQAYTTPITTATSSPLCT